MSVAFDVGIESQTSFRRAERDISKKGKTEYEKIRVLNKGSFLFRRMHRSFYERRNEKWM